MLVGYAMAGLVLGAALAIGLAVAAATLFGISQAEGAYAMQVAFFFTPLGAVVGLIAGLVRARRRRR